MRTFLITLVGVWYKGHRHTAAACSALAHRMHNKSIANALYCQAAKQCTLEVGTPFFFRFYFLLLGGIQKLRWQARGRMGSAKGQRLYKCLLPISYEFVIVNEGGVKKP